MGLGGSVSWLGQGQESAGEEAQAGLSARPSAGDTSQPPGHACLQQVTSLSLSFPHLKNRSNNSILHPTHHGIAVRRKEMKGYDSSWKSIEVHKQKVLILSVAFEGSGHCNRRHKQVVSSFPRGICHFPYTGSVLRSESSDPCMTGLVLAPRSGSCPCRTRMFLTRGVC